MIVMLQSVFMILSGFLYIYSEEYGYWIAACSALRCISNLVHDSSRPEACRMDFLKYALLISIVCYTAFAMTKPRK